MSSLQALLDAQEQRRGGGSGCGGGNGRVGRGHSSHNYQSRPFSSSSQSWSSSSHSTSLSSTNNRNASGQQWQHDQGEGLRGGTYNNDSGGDHSRYQRWHSDQPLQLQAQQQQQPSSTRWQREEEAAGRGNPRRGYGNSRHFNSTAADTSTKHEGTGEATYEQRRANIEQRAIDDSRNEMRMRSRRSSLRRDYDDDEQKDTNNSRHDNGEIDFEEKEDIKSLSSWVGPLVAIHEDNNDDPNDKTTKHHKMICTYYQDREKRYPFYTDERGYQLLHRLLEANYELLRMNHRLIGESAATFQLENSGIASKDEVLEGGEISCDNYVDAKDVIIRIGRGLYAHKPTLRTKGVTWSTEEYSHPGLARMYLRMKSIQRFTEIWCLLERSAALGVFDEIFDNKGKIGSVVGEDEAGGPVIRIAAVGGGPGYELLATKLFFEERMPNSGVQLELTCMDICPAWRHYAEALGFTFVEYDINNEDGINPLQAMGLARGELHFCIVSCVMIYVTNDHVMNMFHNLVHNDGVKAVLVSERGERTLACTMMEELGGKVIRLIDQSDGMDERQAIWCSQEFADEQLKTCHPDYEAHQSESVFPNVPYCEHKERRRRRPQSGRYRK